MKKKLLVILLVVAMLVMMLPASALAHSGATSQHSHKWKSYLTGVEYNNRIVVQTSNVSQGLVNQLENENVLQNGDTWNFTAEEKTGYQFSGWTFSNAYLVNVQTDASSKTLTFSYKKNSSVAQDIGMYGKIFTATANFTPVPTYTLTTSVPGGNGSITKNPNTSTYSENTSVTLTAVPSDGYYFSGWSGDLTGTTNPATLTMSGNKTVTATFTALPTYTVDVSVSPSGAGTIGKSPDVAVYWQGRNVTLTATAATGYRFTGWTGGVTSTSNPVTFPVTSNTTVTANFVKQYYITLNTSAGGHFDSESAVEGWRDENTTINLSNAGPDNNSGYRFIGWRDDSTGQMITNYATTSYSYTVTENHTFTAMFGDSEGLSTTVNDYSKGYLANDLSGMYGRGAVINLNSAQPTAKTGYTFSHWEEYNGGWEDVSLVSGEPIITIGDWNYFRAVFVRSQYTVSFEENGGTAVADQTVTYGSKATKPADPTRTGYDFAGWYSNSGLTTAFDFNQKIYDDTTAYAKWTAHTYTVVYNANGGSGTTASSTHTYDVGKALTSNGFSLNGYEFAGWATILGGDVEYDNNEPVVNLASANGATVNLYAVWDIVTFSIDYDLDGGSASNPASYTVTSTDITLNNPTKTGYTFLGWTGTELSGNTMTVVIPTGSTGNREYTANWSLDTYTISYDLDGGSVSTPNPESYTVETPDFTLTNPTKTGYTFAGWTGTGLNGSVMDVTIEKGSTGNRSYTATWTANTYTVRYDINGGESGTTADSSHTYDVYAPLTANAFVKTGYTFAGWSAISTGAVDYLDSASVINLSAVNEDVVILYAVWTPNTYTVTYKANGGTGTTADSSHTYDEALALTANGFSRTGYTFAGWATSETGAAVYVNSESVLNLTAEDEGIVTLYAVWTPNTYTVKYDINGGDSGTTADSSHTYDVSATLTANGFSRTGYTFAGWATSGTGAAAYANGASVKNLTDVKGGTVTLYAVWKINTFTVTFYDYDGTQIDTQTVNWNTAAIAPTNPTRTGYRFTGWDTSFSAVTADLKVTAQYVIRTYTVTFTDYDGTVIDTQTVRYNNGADAPDDPQREGYDFIGWDVSFDPIRSDLSVTAQYAIKTFTVTFVDFDGTVISTQTVDWNTAATAPEEPSREGYEFTGWDVLFDAVTDNITITAQYLQSAQIDDENVPDGDGATEVDTEDVPLGGGGFAWWWILVIVGGLAVLFFLIFFLARRKRKEEPAQ